MQNLPELTLALSVVVVAAYLAADLIGRAVHYVLRGVLADATLEARFVDRPRRIVRFAIFLLTTAALSFPALTLAGYRTRFGGSPEVLLRWTLDAGLRIVMIGVLAYLLIRIGSAAARRFEREMSRGTGLDVVERTKRAQTLGQLLQKALSSVVIVMAGLMILRELQVDITPVLTGAGIVGLAVGFGAQTLVRDVISGFFMILEDQVRVGDVAAINGEGGLVEQVNLRTIVLRDEEGAVHVFPNGEVKTLVNRSKDFSYSVLTIRIADDEDPDRVEDAIRDAGAMLVGDTNLRTHILEPIEVFGIEAFEPGQLVLKARIKTVPLKQWLVGRELRRRIAKLFTERGIHAPVPQMRVRVERDGRGGEDGRRGQSGEGVQN